MSLEIYSGQSDAQQATAVAAIKLALAGFIETIADGGKDLNREAAKAYLHEQFLLMVAGGYCGMNIALDYGTNYVDTMLAPIEAELRKIRAAADHPVAVSPADAVAAVYRMQGEARRLSAELTAYYANTPREVGDVIVNYLRDNNIEANLPDGVTRAVVNRAVIVTFVTDRSEESAPSPVSALVEMDQNDTLTITRPAYTSGRNITHWRPYRSASANNGAAFRLIPNPADEKGFAIATTSITDDLKDEELQEECPTTMWAEPRADMEGIKAGPNGVNAGYVDNNWCPCEPYVPYAWPREYEVTTDFPIVGHAVVDQGWVILTRGKPYLVAGTDPAQMAARKLEFDQACVAKRGIVEVPGGVVYPSADGLCLIDSAGNGRVLTGELFTKEQWEALVPSSIFAAAHEGVYRFNYNTGSVSGTYELHLASGKLSTSDVAGSTFYRDLFTDVMYAAEGTAIKAIMRGATRRTGTWKSKRVVLASPANFAWLQVDSSFESAVTVKVYADGTLWHTATVSTVEPVRLPQGRYREWEVQVESAASAVTSVILASTTAELRAV
jgi:hypothetical protein